MSRKTGHKYCIGIPEDKNAHKCRRLKKPNGCRNRIKWIEDWKTRNWEESKQILPSQRRNVPIMESEQLS